MVEHFRNGSLTERAAWIALALLVIFAAAAAYFDLSPPSGWFDWNAGETAEWLGWVGAAGLAFAIWQLAVAASAATRARRAVEDALARLSNFDISMDLSSVVIEIQYAQDALSSSNFAGAHISCERAFTIVERIRRQHSNLPSTEKTVVDTTWHQLSSASSALRRNDLGSEAAEALIGTLRELRGTLADSLASLREPRTDK